MSEGTPLDFEILAQPYSPEKDEFISVLYPVWTSADLADSAHRVNVKDKFLGKPVFDSTLNEVVYASGAAAADSWIRGIGDVAETVANLGTAAHAINTVGKYIGKIVYDTAGGLAYAADGPDPTDTWTLLDGVGATQTTPS